jgi:methionyl-tRNA formyltransferase
MVNVLLIGMGITTLSALQSLLSTCNVQAIVRNINAEADEIDPVFALAEEAGIPIVTETSQAEIAALILKFQPDCVVISSYHQILPASLIAHSTFVNVHYSPLPLYRGRANVNWALINDEPYAAITIHKLLPELDAGNILFQQLIPIGYHDTVANVYDKLNSIQQQYLGKVIHNVFNGDEGIPQHHAEATYCCTRLPEDGEVDWAASTRSIDCLIRALVSPFPGAYTYFQGEQLTIWQAEPVNHPPVYVGRIPGRLVARSKTEGYVDVLTGDGILRIFEVQLAGSEKTAAANVIRSIKTTLGLPVSELLKRIQTLEHELSNLKANAK